MNSDASPFFIRPHRFDDAEATDDAFPWLDRRRQVVLDEGERVLWRGQVEVAGYLLRPRSTSSERVWTLPRAAELTVTDRRLAYVCEGWSIGPTAAAAPGLPRHRRHGPDVARVATGQVRWQWPARLHLLPGGGGAGARTGRIMLVCDSLRTIRQPSLALGGAALTDPGALRNLAHLIRRAVAGFRLANPSTTELSPPERDALRTRARAALFAAELTDPRLGVDLPGALPIEFFDREDYYRRSGPGMPGAVSS